MPFKIGSANLIPSFAVMTLCIAGIGALPYGVRWLFHGEPPAIKDRFERYLQWKEEHFDPTAPHAGTMEARRQAQRGAMEEEWRRQHTAISGVKLA